MVGVEELEGLGKARVTERETGLEILDEILWAPLERGQGWKTRSVSKGFCSPRKVRHQRRRIDIDQIGTHSDVSL